MLVADEIFKRVPDSLKNNFKEFITGKSVSLRKTTVEETDIDVEKFGKFMQSFFERSQFCLSSILKDTDSKRIQNSAIMEMLPKWCKKQQHLFVENGFSKLPAFLQKTTATPKKIKAIKEYCNLNMVSFLYYVKEMNKKDVVLMREVFSETLKLAEKNDHFLDNYISLCMLNANLPTLDNPIVPFQKACKLSHDLASITNDELFQYETFFWYIALHWPTQKELEERKQCRTYDEVKLLSCIQKLKELQDESAFFLQRRKEIQKQHMRHNPIFFLKNEIGFEKLASSSNNVVYHLAKLPGKIKDRSNLEYVLPGNKTVTIRAAHFRYNRGSSAQNVKFTLGFSLAGPVAYHIERSSDEIQRYNDFGEEQ